MTSRPRHPTNIGEAILPATVQDKYVGDGFEFYEITYGAAGNWDSVSTKLHIASNLSPLLQRIGSSRAPFLPTLSSSGISIPGNTLRGAWQGYGHSYHLFVSPGIILETLGYEAMTSAIIPRPFARLRDYDYMDLIIQNILHNIAIDVRAGNPSGPLFIETSVVAVIHCISGGKNAAEDVRFSKTKGGLSSAQLKNVIDLIDDCRTKRLSISAMAKSLNLSTQHFCRAFQISTGIAPHRYVLERRVHFAKWLIKSGVLSLAETAQVAGFTDQSQMAATFRKVIGASPSQLTRNNVSIHNL